MKRRLFLRKLVAVPFLGATSAVAAQNEHKLKILMKSAWGSDDPTKAAFPFLHGDALSDAGHDVQIFLLGSGLSDAEISSQRGGSGRLATASRSSWQARDQENTDLCLRGLFSCARSYRSRSGRIRRKVW